jgi:hypothetical protein
MGDIFDQIAGNVEPSVSGGAIGMPVAAAPAMPQGDIFDQLAGNVPGVASAQATAPSYGSAALGLLSEVPGNVWSGIKKTPGALADMVMSIPSGISNLANLPTDLAQAGADATKLGYATLTGADGFTPVGTPEGSREVYDRLGRTFRGIGGLAATVAGGGTPLGAVVGGAAGATAFNEGNQLTGVDAPMDPREELKGFEENVAMGALLKAVMTGGKKAAENMPELANTLDRRSLGTRASDYGKVSDTRTINSPAGNPETFLKASLNDLLENGKLGASRDPAKITKVIDAKTTALSSTIDTAIKQFDQTNTSPVVPSFNNALQYIYDGKVPADLIGKFTERLDNIDKAIQAQGGGKLSFLQKQKVAFGKSYDPADKVMSGFNRAIYSDLKSTIEQNVPEVKGLNAELAKYLVTEPIVNRALKAGENASPLSKLGALAYTTGGIGAPTIAGTILGGPVGTAVGAGVGLATKAAASPTGQALIARVLRQGAKADPLLDALTDPTVAGAQATMGAQQAQESNKTADLLSSVLSRPKDSATAPQLTEPKMEDAKNFNTKVVDIAKDLDTDPSHLLQVMKFETGGTMSSTVKNQAGSGATGLIQFMPATAKGLTGAESKEAAIKILEDMTPVEQLDYVKKYLAPFKGKLNSLEDVYMAVLYPKAVGKDADYTLFRRGEEGTKEYTAYWQNRGLDINKDGVITKLEAASKVRNYKGPVEA